MLIFFSECGLPNICTPTGMVLGIIARTCWATTAMQAVVSGPGVKEAKNSRYPVPY